MKILERFVVVCVLLTPVVGLADEKAALLPFELETTKNGELLLQAIRNGETVAVNTLLSEGVSGWFNDERRDGDTALLLALKYNRPIIAGMLILSGAAVNATGGQGVTALMSAACQENAYDSMEMVQLLLKHGADPNAIGEHRAVGDGKTALMFAADRARTDVVIALLKAGADTKIATREHGNTALYFAVFCKCEEGLPTVRALLEAHADPNQISFNDGTPPLMISASEGCTEAAVLLLKYGAHPNAADTSGRTALIFAAEQEAAGTDHPALVRALVEGGAACETDHTIYLESLLVSSVPTILFASGQPVHTALMRAAQLWQPKTVRVLLEVCSPPTSVAGDAFMDAAKSTNHGTSAQGVDVFVALSAVSSGDFSNWVHTARTLAVNCKDTSTGTTFLSFLQLIPLLDCTKPLCSSNTCSADECPESPHNARCGILFECLPKDTVVINLAAESPELYCYHPDVLDHSSDHSMAKDPVTRLQWLPYEIPACPEKYGHECDAGEKLVNNGGKATRKVTRGSMQGITEQASRRLARTGGLKLYVSKKKRPKKHDYGFNA